MDHYLLPGFENPVHDSQRWYRAVLDGMAHPGTLVSLPRHCTVAEAPPPLDTIAASLVLTLLDHETSVWLQQPEGRLPEELVQWLQFHCGCPLVSAPQKAMFALIFNGEALPDMAKFAIGTPEFPDRSTTLFIQVRSLEQGSVTERELVPDSAPDRVPDRERTSAAGQAVTLQGPGIETAARFYVDGLGEAFWQRHAANAALFPQGFDTVLTAPQGLVCIPRSVVAESLSEGEADVRGR